MRIIGLTGPARSGKDTVAAIIQSSVMCEKFSFAHQIKEMLRVGIGVDIGNDKDSKEFLGVSHREIIQTLGTEWGRNMIHADVWVKAMEHNIKMNAFLTTEVVVVTDVRFPNEAKWVREHGTLIHIVGRGGIKGRHSSEDGIPLVEEDLIIENHSTFEDLKKYTLLTLASCLQKDGV